MGNLHELKNGLLFVLAESAGGIYNGEQLKKICEVAQDDSVILKVTEDQCIGFMLEPGRVETVRAMLEPCGVRLRMYRAPAAPAPKACLGELCRFSVQDSLGDSIELGANLAERFPDASSHFSIGMNGCEQACVGSSVDDIHIVGEESGYKISIGGRAREISQPAQFLIDNVSRENLNDVVARVYETFVRLRQGEETLFDVLEREGMSAFNAAAEGTSSPLEASLVSDETVNIEESLNLDESVNLEESVNLDKPVNVDESESLDVVSRAEGDLLLTDGELDVPVDSDLVDLEGTELDVMVDSDSESVSDVNERVKEKLNASEELAGAALDENAIMDTEMLVSEVDVDEELIGVVQTQKTVSELNADVEVQDVLTISEELDVSEEMPISDDLGVSEEMTISDDLGVSEEMTISDDLPESEEIAISDESPLSEEMAISEELVVSEEMRVSDNLEFVDDLDSSANVNIVDVDDYIVSADSSVPVFREEKDETDSEVKADELSDAASADISSFEESDMAFEEAGSDDVARMTAAFHSEKPTAVMTEKHSHAPSRPQREGAIAEVKVLEPKDSELKKSDVSAYETQAVEPKSAPIASKSKGRLKLKMGTTDVKIVLPNGIECSVPLSWVESQGIFEMDVGENTLVVEKQGDLLVFRYGDLLLSVPSMTLQAAA